MTDKIELTEAEWRERLTPEQYDVLRRAGTERAFTGQYDKNKAAGVYVCAGCGEPLFASDDKYNSGSGWPSYTAPLADGAGRGASRHRARHGPHRGALRPL